MNDWLLTPSLRFGLPFGMPMALLFFVGLCVLTVLGVREHRSLAKLGRRRLLDALRISTALTAFALVLQPEWLREELQSIAGRIAIVLDVSRSMSVREGEHSRWSEAKSSAARAFDAAKQKPSLFTFADELSPITRSALSASDVPLRDDTRIEHALRSLAGDHASDLGAVLLISDGADRNAAEMLKTLPQLGVKVHTLAVGGDTPLHDVSIESVSADRIAFLRQPVQVDVTVRVPEDHEGNVTVTLRHGAEVLRELDVPIGAEHVGNARFSFTPTRIGREAYTVSVPVEADDAVPQNNERAFLLRVAREKLRILLVCGEPSWDARFLRGVLKNDPAIDLITFFILRTQTDNSMASPSELSLIPFPTEELFEQHLSSFDLVIFQDFDFGPYQMARYLPMIRDYVVNGGSFAMLGGARSFGPGGYLGTPIAEVLPVKLIGGEQALDEAQFSPVLVPEATHHPIVELSPQVADNQAAWAGLAPLIGANRVAGISEGAQALLVHPTLHGEHDEPMPVLAVGSPAKGRSMALMTDASYRWGITTAGLRGDASAYERFWDRALRWLSRDPLLDPAQISSDKERYGPGAKVRVSMWLRDQRYQPLAQKRLRVSVSDDRGGVQRETAAETDAEGRALLELSAPDLPGAYSVVATEEGQAAPLAKEVFVVEAGGDELADPRVRADVMQRIAAATSGTFYAHPSALPSLDALPHTRTRVIGTHVFSPCSSPWFVALFLALFSTEWWLRRRFGLR